MIHALGLLVLMSLAANPPYEILDVDREVALARSAGLPPWNEEATIYALGPEGYFIAKDGTNGFSCMVGRSEPGTRWPVCFDAAEGYVDTPVLWRPDLPPGTVVDGPAILEEFGSTVPLHPGFSARIDEYLNIIVTRKADQ